MIVKIALCGICICVLNTLLRQYNKSYIIFVEIVFLCVAATLILTDATKEIKSLSELLAQTSSQKKLMICLLKGAGICIVTKLACDISYESGNILIGDVIELSGRILLVIISMPFMESVVRTAIAFAS